MSNTRMYYVLIVLLGVSSLASGRSLQSSTYLAMNTSTKASPLPIVLWHGLGDSCCSNNSIGYVANQLRESLNGEHNLKNDSIKLDCQFKPALSVKGFYSGFTDKKRTCEFSAQKREKKVSLTVFLYSRQINQFLWAVFVYSIATGSGMAADVFSTYYGNVNQQVCAKEQTFLSRKIVCASK